MSDSFLSRLFKGSSDREIKKMMAQTRMIDALEPELQTLSDDGLRSRAGELRTRAQNGEKLDSLLVPAFALVREAGIRTLGQRHYPVQMVGGMVMHQGDIAEMRTGEGKTLVSTLPGFLNALPGQGVHIVTVNEYLVERDSEWMGKIYRFLGLEVGQILSRMEPAARKVAYAADITYGTNTEFGFDYLRDNMAKDEASLVQRVLNYAIIDEVDSVLIDEARTPLIISGAGEKSTDIYVKADAFVRRLREGEEDDYVRDEKKKTINLTESGVEKAERHFAIDNWADPENTELSHHVNQALRANYLMFLDRDYVVQDDEVLIVDEFTGRIMIGRRYSSGLHQAIEAKEKVTVARENRTMATITYQNFFRMYNKICGMTGTAKTEEQEFAAIYGMNVLTIPTNKPIARADEDDIVYRTMAGKYKAVVEEIRKVHATGQPMLVGTVSVEKSELLSRMLSQVGVEHRVLNAKHHQKEASIIAQAGSFGAVTIATNMAGRGTDIKLGGNPEFLARTQMLAQGMDEELVEAATAHNATDDPTIIDARAKFAQLNAEHEKVCDADKAKVLTAGGLYILGTERHESRRIDNQLRGRAGRQGDPGVSRFFLAMEDDLMRLFGGERMANTIAKISGDEDLPLTLGMLSSSIERAQKRIELNHYQMRKRVLEYDDVMNQQRQLIYSQRNRVLHGGDVHDQILEFIRSNMTDMALPACPGGNREGWAMDELCEDYDKLLRAQGLFEAGDLALGAKNAADIGEKAGKIAVEEYERRIAEIAEQGYDFATLERGALLGAVDSHWMDHIDAMDQLRDGIGLRAYGSRDPVIEYKNEGFDMFDAMINGIREQTVRMLLGVKLEEPAKEGGKAAVKGDKLAARPKENRASNHAPAKAGGKVGRNDPCPCGSGQKYKNCCGN